MKKRWLVGLVLLIVFCLSICSAALAVEEDVSLTLLYSEIKQEDVTLLNESLERLNSDASVRFNSYFNDLGTTEITKEDLQKVTLSEPIYVFSPIKSLTAEDNYLTSIANRHSMVDFIVYAAGNPVGYISVKKEGGSFTIYQVTVGELFAKAVDKAVKSLGGGVVIALPCAGEYFFANVRDEVAWATAAPDYADTKIPLVTLAELGDAIDKNVRELSLMYPDDVVPGGGTNILEILYEGREFARHQLDTHTTNIML